MCRRAALGLVVSLALCCGAGGADFVPWQELPQLSVCAASGHPALPARWRAVYLMAPFTQRQLALADIVHDAGLGATRISLYGVKRGFADFLISGHNTYELSTGAGRASCTTLGDTGWRPLPRDWLTSRSRCAAAAPIGETPVDWWKTPIDPAPSSYWVWYRHSDHTPFRLVFEAPSTRLAPFSQFALSYQVSFAASERSDLAALTSLCKAATPSAAGRGAKALSARLDAMALSPERADAALAQLMPALHPQCSAPSDPLWPDRLALTGVLTPFDANDDPAPAEVLYDWSVPGQRSRIFLPRGREIVVQDALLLRERGYTVSHPRDGAPICVAGLPGTIRPDWAARAPCECAASIDAGTSLTPSEATRILVCPLAPPRVAWAWYTASGRPSVFMVTSRREDAGSGSFALLDYHRWTPDAPVEPATFDTPPQCTAAASPPQETPGAAPKPCFTCHLATR